MTYAETVLSDSPLAYWPLGANGNDASGNGHDLSVENGSGLTYGTQSLVLGGQPSLGVAFTYALLPYFHITSAALNFAANEPRSFSIWLKHEYGVGGLLGPFGHGTAGEGWGVLISDSGLNHYANCYFNGGWVATVQIQNLFNNYNTWNHFAMTYDGTVGRIYFNGLLVGGPSVCNATSMSNVILNIGKFGEYYYSGSMAHAEIHRKELTQDRIWARYDSFFSWNANRFLGLNVGSQQIVLGAKA